MELELEIARCKDNGRACVNAHDVNRRIIEDDDSLPHFAWVSQNIPVVAALLRGLLEPATPENR
jgi:hypothetical protein